MLVPRPVCPVPLLEFFVLELSKLVCTVYIFSFCVLCRKLLHEECVYMSF